ncbi:hypothetical protein NDU88_001864 [Pleurodeles waltl]|uniref:CCHC-type domain-containing protein n=1 Tax=Pleurodeles waltl TaxID=8319 RepID=A0AAV7MM59_PLEWA|nr:hypothetical protein NDU88_001864 [Pleurodeles waltl]
MKSISPLSTRSTIGEYEKRVIKNQSETWMANPIYTHTDIMQTVQQMSHYGQQLAIQYMIEKLEKDWNSCTSDSTTLPYEQELNRFWHASVACKLDNKGITEGICICVVARENVLNMYDKEYPMREVHPDLPPQAAIAAAANRPPPVPVAQFVQIPWKREEVMAIKKDLPNPRNNPAGFYWDLRIAISNTTMTLKDINYFFAALLGPEVWHKIRRVHDAPTLGATWGFLEAHEARRAPGALPHQDILNLPNRILTKLENVIPLQTVDWGKLATYKQKTDEDIPDNFTRIEQAFIDFIGQDLATVTGVTLFIERFVNGLLPEISQKLKATESLWMTKGQAEILQMAQYYESRYKEELEKKEKSVKDMKKKVLLQQAYPQRDPFPQLRGGPPRGRGRGRGRGVSAPPQDRRLNINQCAYCKQDGHWCDTCSFAGLRQVTHEEEAEMVRICRM